MNTQNIGGANEMYNQNESHATVSFVGHEIVVRIFMRLLANQQEAIPYYWDFNLVCDFRKVSSDELG